MNKIKIQIYNVPITKYDSATTITTRDTKMKNHGPGNRYVFKSVFCPLNPPLNSSNVKVNMERDVFKMV